MRRKGKWKGERKGFESEVKEVGVWMKDLFSLSLYSSSRYSTINYHILIWQVELFRKQGRRTKEA